VLERAIHSTHPRDAETFWNQILKNYRQNSKNATEVIKRFEEGLLD
jgi:tRNA A-37 threonylcarbamoyl transferase component Bud32